MKRLRLKVLIISFLYLTSISLIGWNGNENQSQNISNMVQSDELTFSDYYDSLLLSEDHNVEYDKVPSQNFYAQEVESAPLGKPMLSMQSVQYISHDPIYITNNNDFLANNFTGRGTEVDPYLFSDFEIVANYAHLIFIRDTTAFFNISNNLLNGVSGSLYGIYLLNVTNGYIESNEIFSCSYGVRTTDSYHVDITDNTVYNSTYNGIYLVGSSSILVESNYAYLNVHGISLTNSWSNSINGNWVEDNNGQGIALYNSSYLEIRENEIWHNDQRGIFDSLSTNNSFVENFVIFNNVGGFYFSHCKEHTLSGNIVTNNSATGIVLVSTNQSTVNNNEVKGNIGDGMFLSNSHGNELAFNGIFRNAGNGITIINSNSNYIHHNDILDSFGSIIDAPIRYSRLSEENYVPYADISPIVYSIKGTTSGHGIFLDPSSGNIFEFNNIFGNSGSGAYLFEANSNEFNENDIRENSENGVFLENSNNNTLDRNIINNNGGSLLASGFNDGDIKFSIRGTTSGHGIFLDPSIGNTIKNNEIKHNVLNGISLFESDNTFIEGNTIAKNDIGIYLENSSYCNITRNTIAKNGKFPDGDKLSSDFKFSIKGTTSGHGIFLDPSDFNTITDNTVFGNQGLGLYLMDSDKTIIKRNIFSVNRLYAIFADLNSGETLVAQNDFYSNNWVFDDGQHDDGLIRDDGEHGDSQVRDDGQHSDFTGNYWNDLVGDIYYLAGLAGNSDTQPADAPFFPPGYEFTSPTVFYPNGGETLTGIVTVQWYEPSNEKYPDGISYWVFYSNNAGSKWFILPFGPITTTSDPTGQKLLNIEWDTKTVEDGSEYLIQVVAVDEVGSVVSDKSDEIFQIKNEIETTKTTTTTETTPSITPAWTILGSLLSIGSCGWLSIRKRRSKKN
jgi:parallel beta-helix repeat protein